MVPAWLRISRASPCDVPCQTEGKSLPHPGARPAKAITRRSTLQEILEAYGTRNGLDVDKVIAAIKDAGELT